MKKLLAIDPGASGGFAWLGDEVVCCGAMPETEGDVIFTLRAIVAANHIQEAIIEDVGKGVIPGRAVAMISLNVNAAVIRTTLTCLGVRILMVKPATWQAIFGLGKRCDCASDSVWKNKLKSEAQRRFPNVDITLKTADALLIFEWGQKQ